MRTYGDKVYINFCGLNVSEDHIACKSFQSFLLIFFIVFENKYYLQVYLDNCAYRIAKKQMTDHPDKNHFATD